MAPCDVTEVGYEPCWVQRIPQTTYLCMPGGYFWARTSENAVKAKFAEHHKGMKKGPGPKEPDPRLTLHYLRTVRRTDVMRLLVPSALRTSSVCVLNSVPMYFMGFRTVLTSATGAVSFGTAASWLIASSFLSVWWQGESVCSGWLALV